jgi:hypothetical protein
VLERLINTMGRSAAHVTVIGITLPLADPWGIPSFGLARYPLQKPQTEGFCFTATLGFKDFVAKTKSLAVLPIEL